jgi:hypothetical protein
MCVLVGAALVGRGAGEPRREHDPDLEATRPKVFRHSADPIAKAPMKGATGAMELPKKGAI